MMEEEEAASGGNGGGDGGVNGEEADGDSEEDGLWVCQKSTFRTCFVVNSRPIPDVCNSWLLLRKLSNPCPHAPFGRSEIYRCEHVHVSCGRISMQGAGVT